MKRENNNSMSPIADNQNTRIIIRPVRCTFENKTTKTKKPLTRKVMKA